MTVDQLVAIFATINDRAALIAFLAPLRLPHGLPETERARVGPSGFDHHVALPRRRKTANHHGNADDATTPPAYGFRPSTSGA